LPSGVTAIPEAHSWTPPLLGAFRKSIGFPVCRAAGHWCDLQSHWHACEASRLQWTCRLERPAFVRSVRL